jgi:hypothetical protein
MWALVKFHDQTAPVTFGLSNSGHGKNLATMENVEWVQVISPTGYVLRYDNGASYPDNIAPIPGKPEHKCPEAVVNYQGLSVAQLRRITDAINRSCKIEAIKHYRTFTNCSLKMAKEFVEALGHAMGEYRGDGSYTY